jgi:fluoroacetyl-CoA thioesterase
MIITIKPNSKGTAEIRCTKENTADRYAKGTVPVFATPALVGLMEDAAVRAIKDQLPEGYTTVGGGMNLKHLAATPVGLTVRAEATLINQDRKKLTFAIKAWDDKDLVGEAEHDRFIVEKDKFLERAYSKVK